MELYEFCNKLFKVVWNEAVCIHTLRGMSMLLN